MSRDAGKPRTAAKRQPGKKPSRRMLEIEEEPLDLEKKAQALAFAREQHSQWLSSEESHEIRHQVEELSLEADKLLEVNKHTQKVRSRQLETAFEKDTPQQDTSSEHEEIEETASRVDSQDTKRYSEYSRSSPSIPYNFGVSPSLNSHIPPFQFNPPVLNNPTQTSPIASASQLDPMSMIQTMFSQQAEANKQQAEANRQLQLLLASSLDKQIDQQSKQTQQQANIVARQAIADVRTSIKPMREGVNVCQYFEHLEIELREAMIPPNKWKNILVAKLSTKAEKSCAHLIHNSEATYTELKKHLLRHIGPSADELCHIVHGAAYDESRDKKETEKLQHAKYLAERYFLGVEQQDETNIHHMAMRLYKFHCHKRFAHTIKLSKSQTLAELLELTSSFDSQLDYEKVKTDRPSTTYNRSLQKHKTFCDYCRKPGHREIDCFKKQNASRHDPSRQQTITYKPKEEKYSSYNTNKKQPYKDAGVKPRPATVNWNQTTTTTSSIEGLVNGHEASVIIDTGAQITVVPGKFVYDDDLTGETISIMGVNGNPMPYQTARVPITLKGTTVFETVAVAPAHQLNTKVLLSTPVNKITTEHLLDSYLSKQQQKQKQAKKNKSVNQVKMYNLRNKKPVKYFPEEEESIYEDDRASDLSYNTDSETDTVSSSETTDRKNNHSDEEPSVETYAPSDKYLYSPTIPSSPHHPSNQTPPTSEPYSSTHSTEQTSSTPPIEPYSSNPVIPFNPHTELDSSTSPTESKDSTSHTEPYSSKSLNILAEPYSSHSKSLNTLIEPYSSTPVNLNTEQDSSDISDHDQLSQSNNQMVEIPEVPVSDTHNNRESIKAEIKSDPTLKTIRGLAHHNKNRYVWDDSLLFHMSIDPTLGEKKRLVVPKSKRQALIEIAHDKAGHFSAAKTRATLNNKFTWPGMGTDVQTHISACVKCKQYNKNAHKQAPLYTRPVITEPYEEIAMDIIGPLPRSKIGYRYALTTICMASRWPEVYPLNNIETESIANGLVEFMCRNGIPNKVLTDHGTQFTSNVMQQTCQMLGITQVQTVPYRPQGNGILERFHGTLKPLLAKAASDGIDWPTFLPLALSAIRAIPCCSTGFSPAEIVYGKNTRNFLDVVFEGWTDPSHSKVDIASWVLQLSEKLEILRDTAALNNYKAREKQNAHSPKSRSTRKYKQGDLVFCRIPGCRATLQASWEGPFRVNKGIPPLNYEVQDLDKTWSKITHINNLRTYRPLPQPKPLRVDAACLVAEETKELSNTLSKAPALVGGPCLGYSQQELDTLLNKYNDVFSPTPGEAQVTPFKIKLQDDAATSSRPPYQVPIHLRGEVNKEINKLMELKIIEPSQSVDWCAPIVPVRKPDKSIRLCIDYREINKVTPLDRHMIPTLPEILDKIGRATVISKVDLTSGFHQIPVEQESRDLTTLLSPMGKFRFTRMPFGLKNAPSHFQRTMEKALQPVLDCAAVYIDDIVIFSNFWEDHMTHLARVFNCFKQAQLTAKISKCSFGKTQLQYLGHTIGSGQLAVPEHRVAALE